MGIVLRIFLKSIDLLGINALFGFINKDKAVVLWYHGVRGDDSDPPESYARLNVKEAAFKSQLRYLKKEGFSFVTMSELASAVKSGTRVGKLAVITFDDGYENTIRLAYPAMREIGAKGCLYVVSGATGGKDTVWTALVASVVAKKSNEELVFRFKDEQLNLRLGAPGSYRSATVEICRRLRTVYGKEFDAHFQQIRDHASEEIPDDLRVASIEQMRGLDKDVLEIGSHTATHPDCTRLSSQGEYEYELVGSRSQLGEGVRYDIRHFCYPFGLYDSTVVAQVKESGYETAVTTNPGLVDERSDLLALSRIGATEDFLLFKAMTSGAVLPMLKPYRLLRKLFSGGS